MYRTDDPYADFDSWDREREERLQRLPQCSQCDQHIQTEKAYYINGEWICEECMEDYHKEVDPDL